MTHQMAQARISDMGIRQALAEQGIRVVAEAALIVSEFTTEPSRTVAMLEQVNVDAEFERLVASLIQDAGRAAESVSTAIRPNVAHVRHLTLPSCSRCVTLAGRVYRWSDGFLRHPNCDCVMVPTTIDDRSMVADPADLAEQGLVTGLSKADMQALRDGADFNQVVNVRRSAAGLQEAGRVLARRDRLTPEGIYRLAQGDRAKALEYLRHDGYIR